MKRSVLLLGFLALGTKLYARQPTVASVLRTDFGRFHSGLGNDPVRGDLLLPRSSRPGQFTIPSVLLQALPVTSVAKTGTSSQTMGGLEVGSLTATFIAPPPAIDLATTSYIESTEIVAGYQ